METNSFPKTIAELGIRLTSKGSSYWNSNGAYQKEGDELYDKMVPAQGAAETVNGELIRGINRLFYEYCNNGNCNARIDGSDSLEEDFGICLDDFEPVIVDSYYDKFLTLIESSLIKKIDRQEVHSVIQKVKSIILDDWSASNLCSEYYSSENMDAYNRMSDLVIWYVLNTPDTELPASYDRD